MSERLRRLLEELASGAVDVETALTRLQGLHGFDDLGFARFDVDRHRRTGVAEVIYSPGKTDEQLAALIASSLEHHGSVLVTRIAPERTPMLLDAFPGLQYHEAARIVEAGSPPEPSLPLVAVVSAGTSDQSVSEEAAVVLEHLGHAVDRVTDVGVAGIHRLLAVTERLRAAIALVVVAGMEGALPSVIAGVVDRPVIAVPTSIGYGASFGGVAALLGMLNSCASGVGVVNIDNGFGAAMLAHRIATPPQRGADE